MSAFLASSKTNILGILVLLCSGTSYSEVLGPRYSQLLMLVCGVLTAFGLIAAKDANVTNSKDPAAATVVPPMAQATPNPSAAQ